MTGKADPGPEDERSSTPLTCAVCCKEIPPSEDFMTEAQDYVIYLCGLDCYARWHEHVRARDASGEPLKDS